MELEGLSILAEAYSYLKTFEGIDVLEAPLEYLRETKFQLPEGYTLLMLGDGRLATKARAYMESRGFNTIDLSLMGVGYCRGANNRYWGRIIIPFYERGKIVYFNARKYIGAGPKFDNPPIEEAGIGKSALLYNSDCLYVYEKVYIVESATNALTLGPNALAGGGKVFSSYQISRVLDSPVKEVVIILDPDAYKEALELGLALVNHKKVKVVSLPEKLYIRGIKKRIMKVDVNAVGRDITLKYERKTPFQTYPELFNAKLQYETEHYSRI